MGLLFQSLQSPPRACVCISVSVFLDIMKDKLTKLLLKWLKIQILLNERVIRQARNIGDDWKTWAVIESIIVEETANSEILLNFVETLLEPEKAKAE